MAIFFPPPPVFVGGSQPYAPPLLDPALNNINTPPFDRRSAQIAAEIISLAQAPAWPYEFIGARQPYAPALLSPGIPGRSVDPPPRFHQDMSVVLQAWAQAFVSPPIPRYQINVSVLAVSRGYIIG